MHRSVRSLLLALTAATALAAGVAATQAADKLTIGVSFQQLTDPFFISIIYGCLGT